MTFPLPGSANSELMTLLNEYIALTKESKALATQLAEVERLVLARMSELCTPTISVIHPAGDCICLFSLAPEPLSPALTSFATPKLLHRKRLEYAEIPLLDPTEHA